LDQFGKSRKIQRKEEASDVDSRAQRDTPHGRRGCKDDRILGTGDS
jgi:hypothetical protein